MDRNNPEEEKDQQDQDQQRRSGVDRANDLINKGRNTYNNARRIRNVIRGARAAQGASTAAGSVGTAAATSEVWVPILIIAIIIIAVVVIVIMLFGSTPPASCDGIIADKASASVSSPVTLTLQNCTEGAVVSWSASRTGGAFSPTDTTTTSYTPFSTNTTVTIVITGKVCNPRAPTLCNDYTIDIIVLDSIDYTCPSSTLRQYCSPERCDNPGETSGIGTCPIPTRCCRSDISCADVDERLLKDFGVRIRSVSEYVSCAVKKKIYTIYSMPTQSSKYVSLLKPKTPFTLEFRSGTYGRASGYTASPYLIKLYGFATFISNPSWFRLGSFLLIHETGHLIGQRNYSVKTAFPHSSLVNQDRSCYDRGYLKTYSLRCGSNCGINPKSESFAEAQGLYIYNSKNGSLGDIDNFRTQCDNTYSWIRVNVFGGTTIRILN